MTTTDYVMGSGKPVVPYHVYLLPAAKRGSAWWTSSLSEAEKFATDWEASDAIIDLGLDKRGSSPDVAPTDHRELPSYWSKQIVVDDTPLPKVGDRVLTKVQLGEYPLSPVPAGSLGTVTTVDPKVNSYVGVTMDDSFPDLAEWNNELHIGQEDDDTSLAETFAAAAHTLDSMIDELKRWCFANGRLHRSADELLSHEYGREPRDEAACAFLKDFCARWEQVEARKPEPKKDRTPPSLERILTAGKWRPYDDTGVEGTGYCMDLDGFFVTMGVRAAVAKIEATCDATGVCFQYRDLIVAKPVAL
jgi:hypothetical protein